MSKVSPVRNKRSQRKQTRRKLKVIWEYVEDPDSQENLLRALEMLFREEPASEQPAEKKARRQLKLWE